METDPLQQLRDVHLPIEPSWWPPAPGWWLLAALVIGLLIWATYRLFAAYRRKGPSRAAQRVLNQLFIDLEQHSMSPQDFLHQGNELLKRLLVRAYNKQEYAHLAGEQWLQALDDIAGDTSFTQGQGRILGNARFSANPDFDPTALKAQFELVLTKVKP